MGERKNVPWWARIGIAALAGIFACSAPAGDEPDVGQTAEKVINGTLDTDAAPLYPAVVYLERNDAACTGNLVTRRHILTAAHCVRDDGVSRTFQIRFGADSHTSTRTIQHTFAVSGLIPVRASFSSPPTPSDYRNAHDLAVIRLDDAVPPGWADPMPIAGIGGAPPLNGADEAPYTTVGYGATWRPNHADTAPGRPNQGNRSYSHPLHIYWERNGGNYLLIYDKEPSRPYVGISHGDSGGPLLSASGAILGISSMFSTLPTYPSRFWYTGWAPVMRNDNEKWLKGILENPDGSLKDMDLDADDDGVPDYRDNCVNEPNRDQANTNFKFEYAGTCVTSCWSGGMQPPTATTDPAEVNRWHQAFHGDACDVRVPKLEQENVVATVPITDSGCTGYLESWAYRIPVASPCYESIESGLLVSDGRVGKTPSEPRITSSLADYVETFACNCGERGADDLDRARNCDQKRSCSLRSFVRPALSARWTAGFNRITQRNVKPSEGLRRRFSPFGPDLRYFLVQNSAKLQDRADQRTAEWDLAADLPRMGFGLATPWNGVLWNVAGQTATAGADPRSDYEIADAHRTLVGKTTRFGAMPGGIRIPWYNEVLNPGSIRTVGGLLAPVAQVSGPAGAELSVGPVRVFAFGAGDPKDASAEFTPPLQAQWGQIASGATLLALPSASSTVPPQSRTLGVTVDATTGAVTGVIRRVLSDAPPLYPDYPPSDATQISVVAGSTNATYGWLPMTDATPLPGVTAAYWDADFQQLLLVASGGTASGGPPNISGDVYVRRVLGETGQWSGPEAMGIHLPGRVLGLVRSDAGVRAAVLEGTTLRLLDATPFETNVRLVQRNVTDAWMSTGRVGEIYLTYRGARGVGGVISFLAVHPSARPAIVERLSVKNAYGPAFLANSGLSVLVDPRDGVTPPTVAPASTATGRRDRDDDDHNHSCEDDDRDDRGRR